MRLLAFIFALTAAAVLSKSAQRDLFLAAYPKTRIPDAFLWSALLSCFTSLGISAIAARMGATRLMQLLLWASAVAFALLSWANPMLTYIVVEVLATALLVQGWGIPAEVLDVRNAKRLLPLVGVGAGLAWTGGGFWVGAFAKQIGAHWLLAATPWLLVLSSALLWIISRVDLSSPSRTGRMAETGWQSLVSGVQYVTREPLMRVLAAVITLDLLVERITDFQLLSAAQARFSDTPGGVAAFMGMFYGATGALTLVAPFIVSGAVLTHWGSTRTILGTQLYVLVLSAVFLVLPTFPVIVALCGGDRILKQALAAPARSQMFGVVPAIRRAQAGALLRGVIAALFSAIAALALKAAAPHVSVHALSMPVIVLLGVLAALTARWLQRSYVRALQSSVDRRKLDFDAQATRLGDLDGEQIALLRGELRCSDEDRASFACSLLEKAPPSIARPLLREMLQDERPLLQAQAVRLLGTLGHPRDRPLLWETLHRSRDPQVRSACLRALVLAVTPMPSEGVGPLLDDGSVQVRAMARMWKARAQGDLAPLESMLASASADERAAAAWALGEVPLEGRAPVRAFLPLLTDQALDVRRAALKASGQLADAAVVRALVFALEEPATSAAAFDAFAQLPDSAVGTVEAVLRAAPSPVVSKTAMALSVVRGTRATQALHPLLDHSDEQVRYRASRAMVLRRKANSWVPPAQDLLLRALQRELEVGTAYQSTRASLASWQVDSNDISPEQRTFLLLELDARIRETEARVLALLAVVADPRLGRLSNLLRDASAHTVARVLELLEQSLDEHLATLVLPFFERREGATGSDGEGAGDDTDPLTAIIQLNDPHLRRCALLVYGDRLTALYPDLLHREEPLLHLVERVRFLRSVPLFKHLSPDDLMKLAEIAEPKEYRAGQVIFRKGDLGDVLCVVVGGRVEIRDQGQLIATQQTHDFFGELALFDQEPRSADAVCVEDGELLEIGGADLEALMERRPEIAREIVRVLARRLRRTTEAMVGRTSPKTDA